ncbi:MAG: LysR family transcriptional regulator [marine bacterium B5-7]|nr:MAG: LysR family transcriptional regulator [marine bacterium B5-7]
MLPSAAELEYFIEVSAALNLSRASERLGISQPSLSLAVKRLEKSVGTPLFIRHKQGVTLTQAGKQLLAHVRQLLQYWENTKSQALASQQEVQGYFTLGCHSTIAMHMVSGFLADLLENHTKLEIHLKHDISRRITEQVINLSIDIGIVVNPLKHPDLIIKKLCDDEVTFWVGEGAREIQKPCSKQAIILCDPDLTQTQSLLKKCKKTGIPADRIMTMNSLEVVANLTANGCGIGILPSRVAMSMYPGKLKRVSKAPVYSDEVCLIYRNENRSVEAIQVIINRIQDFFK